MPANRRQRRIPADLGVQMGVQVDEARRHGHAVGIDLPPALAAYLTNFRDAPVADGEVAGDGLGPGTVHEFAASDYDVVHWVAPSYPRSHRRAGVWACQVLLGVGCTTNLWWPGPLRG